MSHEALSGHTCNLPSFLNATEAAAACRWPACAERFALPCCPVPRDVSASASPVPVWPARAFEGTLPGVFPAGAVAHAFTRRSTVHIFAAS